MNVSEVIAQGREGEALLRAGEYARGFRLYDGAWRQIQPNEWLDLPLPRWRGEDLSDRQLLVTGEQGYGDQIMVARFAKLLQQRGAQVTWLCDLPLRRLFNECLGMRVGDLESAQSVVGEPFHCPSGELPTLFFPPHSQPPAAPYIAQPPAKPVPGARFGVVTRGDPDHVHDALRSLPEDAAADLLAVPGAVSLHPADTGAVDFYETAQLIAGLDLVITVDTSVAHLAGAMGKPVWVLLSSVWCDWRWMSDRPDSPWYPSARLFRQDQPGNWAGVVDRVREAVSNRLS